MFLRSILKLVFVLSFFSLIYSCKQRSSDLADSGTPPDYTNAGARGNEKGWDGDGLKSWVDGAEVTDWSKERAKREKHINDYLNEDNAGLTKRWGYRKDSKQNSKVAWKWFEESPVGFGGVPYVVLKTIIDLDKTNCGKYKLCKLKDVWKRNIGRGENLDHLGFGPARKNYAKDGTLLPKSEWTFHLPYGFVFQGGDPKYYDTPGPFMEPIPPMDETSYKPVSAIEERVLGALEHGKGTKEKIGTLDKALTVKRKFTKLSLVLAKLREKSPYSSGDETDDQRKNPTTGPQSFYTDHYKSFGKSTGMDRVFFSCAGCHVGRVVVNKKVKHLVGMPNTEIEAQYFSKLLMLSGAALIQKGFDPNAAKPHDPKQIEPNKAAVAGLYTAMLDKALTKAESFYGGGDEQILRAKFMVYRAAWNFPKIVKDLIGIAIKTHFIYRGIAGNISYNPAVLKQRGILKSGQTVPDLMDNRIGQMDAFGIASGLVAIHMKRPDGSFLKFVADDQFKVLGPGKGQSPAFVGFPGKSLKGAANGKYVYQPLPPQLAGPAPDAKAAAERILKLLPAWAPPIAAPIDVKSLNFSRYRKLANWDGNQGADARTLASGTSATGDPRKVNVEIHEPLNPFINHLPPPPYPFKVDLARARKGRTIFNAKCKSCHVHVPKVRGKGFLPLTVKKGKQVLNTDPARTTTNTSVSQNLLAALVLESCTIYANNNKGKPGAQYCLPTGSQKEKLKNYFDDVPTRVAEGAAGYKADMLTGIWARAPYLHNGSVPTLAHLICPTTRPKKFIRGNINFDKKLVGFEWRFKRKIARYSENDVLSYKVYDTTQLSRSNQGHTFGEDLCPKDLATMTKAAEREKAILASDVGDLIEYLKTL